MDWSRATTSHLRRPVVAGAVPGKAGKAGPGQTKPRLGTTGKPAKPKQCFESPQVAPRGPIYFKRDLFLELLFLNF